MKWNRPGYDSVDSIIVFYFTRIRIDNTFKIELDRMILFPKLPL